MSPDGNHDAVQSHAWGQLWKILLRPITVDPAPTPPESPDDDQDDRGAADEAAD